MLAGRSLFLCPSYRTLTQAIRSRRRKCAAQDNGSLVCVYCSVRGIRCERKASRHGVRIFNAAISSNSPPDGSLISLTTENQTPFLLPLDVCIELVELYFDLVHDQFHSLFHRPSFVASVHDGVAPKVLLFAMMAFSAR